LSQSHGSHEKTPGGEAGVLGVDDRARGKCDRSSGA
jgi:hypothetical protein